MKKLFFGLFINFSFLFGMEFGHKTNPINGVKIPDYVSFQIGLGFTI